MAHQCSVFPTSWIQNKRNVVGYQLPIAISNPGSQRMGLYESVQDGYVSFFVMLRYVHTGSVFKVVIHAIC